MVQLTVHSRAAQLTKTVSDAESTASIDPARQLLEIARTRSTFIDHGDVGRVLDVCFARHSPNAPPRSVRQAEALLLATLDRLRAVNALRGPPADQWDELRERGYNEQPALLDLPHADPTTFETLADNARPRFNTSPRFALSCALGTNVQAELTISGAAVLTAAQVTQVRALCDALLAAATADPLGTLAQSVPAR